MKLAPDSVCNTVLSRSSLKNWTCGAISEPKAAVAIRHPPIVAGGNSSPIGVLLISNCCLETVDSVPKNTSCQGYT